MVICIKVNLEEDTEIKLHYVVQQEHTRELTKCLTSVFIFHYYIFSWCKPQIHAVGGPSNLIVSVSHAIKQEVLHRGCKNNPYKFCNLK